MIASNIAQWERFWKQIGQWGRSWSHRSV